MSLIQHSTANDSLKLRVAQHYDAKNCSRSGGCDHNFKTEESLDRVSYSTVWFKVPVNKYLSTMARSTSLDDDKSTTKIGGSGLFFGLAFVTRRNYIGEYNRKLKTQESMDLVSYPAPHSAVNGCPLTAFPAVT